MNNSIIELLQSECQEDVVLGINLLMNKEVDEILQFFEEFGVRSNDPWGEIIDLKVKNRHREKLLVIDLGKNIKVYNASKKILRMRSGTVPGFYSNAEMISKEDFINGNQNQ